ncbi:ABC transporter ATP-binding protein [Leucobacter sp. M11]|uniref:ABC transporter ATP-binding protein n=1 Tax=Leucobacter sp. M11 TaxID=2993565 RepID=UPI002D7E647B|nr:ATP-binding cassette domain-containing protein [Leucobacter sp. M11]MEB4614571.1 ATP-binding cassette domain-containing protein [Leucobacter sp. M11]
MPRIQFDKIRKSFGSNTVIREFSADIPDNEFLVLLGPSGCGKSTMLRMIAGLTDISDGELRFDGELVNDREPRDRNVAFVFQSYALYPHMTVRENIAFPLIMDRFKGWYHIPILNSIMRRVIAKRPEVRDRVTEVAEMLELGSYIDRRPKTLSGGQRQRVAVARALVRDPSIYLLDEPLSNLDAKLRTQMRAEITALYQRVNKSFVYVTHDQVEAMTMATRIIVLSDGEVRQIGTPEEIYHRPADTFVARFIGAPAMNLIPVRLRDGRAISDSGAQEIAQAPAHLSPGPAMLGVRPEKISLAEHPGSGVLGYISAVEHLGGESVIGFTLEPSDPNRLVQTGSTETVHYARVPGTAQLTVGTKQWFSIGDANLSWFDADTGLAATPDRSGQEVELRSARTEAPAP